MHCNEEEYVLTIAENQKNFYHALIDAGVDILWVNHPHVSKEWEVWTYKDKGPQKIIFYSVGNTISGQRRTLDFQNPNGKREWTGDSFIFQVLVEQVAEKNENKNIKISWINPILITTFKTKDNHFVIKKFDDDFLESLKYDSAQYSYFSERKKLMENIKGKLICQ